MTSRVLLQVLINPALDLRPRSRTYKAYAKYMDWYLNDVQTESKLVYVSPLAAASFQGLPNLHRHLRKRSIELKGMGHLGVLWAAAHPDAEEAMKEVQQAIRQALS